MFYKINKIFIKSSYTYWQIRIFYSIFLGYIFYYFTRKSLIFLSPLTIKDLNLSLSDIGLINTLFYITYGISKFINGMLADRINSRYLMSIGLIFTGLCNILIGLSSNFNLILIFWIFNAIFQSCGWPSITKQLTYWFEKENRGFFWGICSTAHNIGGAFAPILISFLSINFGWKKSICFIGIICVLIGFLLLNRLRDTPESLGLKLRKNKNNLHIEYKNTNMVFYDKSILILSFAYFFVYIIKTCVNDWTVLYFINQKGYSLFSSSLSIFYFEFGGIFGILASGWITDKVFNANRYIFLLLCIIILVVLLIFFWNIPIGYVKLDYIIISLIGFCIFSPQMLIGLIASEIVPKEHACKANGFVSSWAYLGAALTGYPIGLIINLSWNIYFLTILICTIILMIIITLSIIINKKT